ncbi:hypothetical protein LTR78_002873 [Recurvomyces mirabilis]|uniref:DUF1264 domain-containing protein n=1 Tax=Recurvomyces mirabilis TaxID=574656 RepID=A0AAE1C481_9PEZI|nr:hypothetical protein LTR78_002873 [Recurvomyces mirabilis]KAK5159394.1 hypothetical protein LTS14_002536 [Recurvomyces mirabilis]
MNDSQYAPFRSIHEFLTAVHIYADEAKAGKTRYVEATHYCAHVRKDLRQCLIYDSHEQNAKLIGVEYMVPKEVYETFDAEEQKLWHSHEYEVQSGMLICPKPDAFTDDEWEAAELQAMKEIINLYGKTWHFWQVDADHQYPLGTPVLMGSVTSAEQLDLGAACVRRNEVFGVDHVRKAEARKALQALGSGDHPHANSWWKQ